MNKFFNLIAIVALGMLSTTYGFAQQNVDEKYINEQIGKVNEYILLTYGLGQPTAPGDSVAKWQKGHLKVLFQLQVDGKISFFGPVGQDPSIVGIAIFNTNDEAAVKQYIEKGPVHPEQRTYVQAQQVVGSSGTETPAFFLEQQIIILSVEAFDPSV